MGMALDFHWSKSVHWWSKTYSTTLYIASILPLLFVLTIPGDAAAGPADVARLAAAAAGHGGVAGAAARNLELRFAINSCQNTG